MCDDDDIDQVGVARGQFSSHMLNKWRGRRYVMIDPWYAYEGQGTPQCIDDESVDQSQKDEKFRRAIEETKPHGNKATLMRAMSVKAAKVFMNETIDFIYIDALHDYRSSMDDIHAWWPKLRRGGILAGHDYKHFFGCYFAIQEFARKMNIEFFVTSGECGDNREMDSPSWYLLKP